MKNDVTQGSYTCSFETIEKTSIPENLDPFRREYPDRVIKLSKACKRFIDAENEDGKIQVAEETGYKYDFLKGFCKNKYDYKN